MGQVLHGSARTTEAVRRAIQHSQEGLRALARRHGVKPKTIAKWMTSVRTIRCTSSTSFVEGLLSQPHTNSPVLCSRGIAKEKCRPFYGAVHGHAVEDGDHSEGPGCPQNLQGSFEIEWNSILRQILDGKKMWLISVRHHLYEIIFEQCVNVFPNDSWFT
jgi:hypothetical protein